MVYKLEINVAVNGISVYDSVCFLGFLEHRFKTVLLCGNWLLPIYIIRKIYGRRMTLSTNNNVLIIGKSKWPRLGFEMTAHWWLALGVRTLNEVRLYLPIHG